MSVWCCCCHWCRRLQLAPIVGRLYRDFGVKIPPDEVHVTIFSRRCAAHAQATTDVRLHGPTGGGAVRPQRAARIAASAAQWVAGMHYAATCFGRWHAVACYPTQKRAHLCQGPIAHLALLELPRRVRRRVDPRAVKVELGTAQSLCARPNGPHRPSHVVLRPQWVLRVCATVVWRGQAARPQAASGRQRA